MSRITIVYQRLAKVFLICSSEQISIVVRRKPQDDIVGTALTHLCPPYKIPTAMMRSIHRREHLVAAIIGVELSAALPPDRGAACGRRGVLRQGDVAAQSVGGVADLARGKGSAGCGYANHQEQRGDDLDHQSLDRQFHGAVPPWNDGELSGLYHR